MKSLFSIALIIISVISCNASKDKHIMETGVNQPQPETERKNFFPVTAYLLGQLSDLKNMGINPLKITTQNNHTDSAWLQFEDLEKEMREFFEPVIDSTNMTDFFSETRFLDQTMDAYTFTYDPVAPLPDSMTIMHWDVYVDPYKNKVKRVYLLKKEGGKTKHLTWQSDAWCKIITLINSPDDKSEIEKEVLIKWHF